MVSVGNELMVTVELAVDLQVVLVLVTVTVTTPPALVDMELVVAPVVQL